MDGDGKMDLTKLMYEFIDKKANSKTCHHGKPNDFPTFLTKWDLREALIKLNPDWSDNYMDQIYRRNYYVLVPSCVKEQFMRLHGFKKLDGCSDEFGCIDENIRLIEVSFFKPNSFLRTVGQEVSALIFYTQKHESDEPDTFGVHEVIKLNIKVDSHLDPEDLIEGPVGLLF